MLYVVVFNVPDKLTSGHLWGDITDVFYAVQ